MTKQKNKKNTEAPGYGKRDRYIQPSILIALRLKQSYGYELIHNIQEFGFVEGQAPPGMIYRHLRQLEDDGLVVSEWITEGTGAAKRIYQITSEGEEVLELWVQYMKEQSEKLKRFTERYASIYEK